MWTGWLVWARLLANARSEFNQRLTFVKGDANRRPCAEHQQTIANEHHELPARQHLRLTCLRAQVLRRKIDLKNNKISALPLWPLALAGWLEATKICYLINSSLKLKKAAHRVGRRFLFCSGMFLLFSTCFDCSSLLGGQTADPLS